jgi:RNA-splicing ligase RtcB
MRYARVQASQKGKQSAKGPVEMRLVAADARPDCVSEKAKHRQRREMGYARLGQLLPRGQAVVEIFDQATPKAFKLTLHGGGDHPLWLARAPPPDWNGISGEMAVAAGAAGIVLPDRELACAPIRSEIGQRYLDNLQRYSACHSAYRDNTGRSRRKRRHLRHKGEDGEPEPADLKAGNPFDRYEVNLFVARMTARALRSSRSCIQPSEN